MSKLGKVVQNALNATARGERMTGELVMLEKQVQNAFNERLGGIDIFGTNHEWYGGLLRTVIDKSGIAVMYHIGVTLRPSGNDGARIYYQIVNSAGGRAFKFMPHSEEEPVEKSDFFGVGFPYPPDMVALSKVSGGTIARAKTNTQCAFLVDPTARVTAEGIEDVRLYHCGGELADKVQILFEETISGVHGEWNRIFSLLNS